VGSFPLQVAELNDTVEELRNQLEDAIAQRDIQQAALQNALQAAKDQKDELAKVTQEVRCLHTPRAAHLLVGLHSAG
jgi:citrate lyase beta subunit